MTLNVLGKGGLPGGGIGAVALNVTVAEGENPEIGGGYVTVYPCGTRPNASNLNFTSGQTIPNSVIAPVSAGGDICFYVYGTAHLLADVSGYFPVGSGFTSLSPARVLDTRGGAKVGAPDGNGTPLTLNVLGKGGLPGGGIGAVALNVTVAEGENPEIGGGYVTVYPCGTRPNASNLNFTSGQTIPNSVIAPVSAGGDICFYVYGTAHLLADVSGYFPVGSGFTSLSPARVLDTRGGAKVGAPDGNGTPLTLNVLGKGGLPGGGIDAVALNVTVAEGENPEIGGGYVTVYPCGTRPNASNLNFTSGQTIPNSVIAPVSAGGDICFYVYGTAHLLADVSGYFGPGVALVFDVAGATGLALPDGASDSALLDTTASRTIQQRTSDGPISSQLASSSLARVASDGSLSPAVARGVADVRHFLIAPNGNVIVTFGQPVDLVSGAPSTTNGCILAEVNRDSGIPTCIDNSLSSIDWDFKAFGPGKNDPIQFDNSGGIYYAGRTVEGRQVLRRSRVGTITDLINDNIGLFDFLVASDGSIFVSGNNQPSLGEWFRRINQSGGLETIVNGSAASFIRQFPDGNVYFTAHGPGNVVSWVRRYLLAPQHVDGNSWIGTDPGASFDPTPFCPSPPPAGNVGFCSWFGRITHSYTTGDGQVYVLAGGFGSDGTPMQYYPILRKLPTQLIKATNLQGVGSSLVISGINGSDKHVLIMLDTTTDVETLLVGADNEIDIYHMDYVAATNTIMFDGLRFSDNRYGVGQVNLTTKQLTFTPASTAKFVDFATF